MRALFHHRVSLVRLLAGVGVISVAACGGSDAVDPGPNPVRPDTVDVFTPGNVFSPPVAEIEVGDAIRFRMSESPEGDGHNAIFNRNNPGTPADVPIVKDTAVIRTFGTTGTFSYFCTVHPGMAGEVIVH